jgi:hypothetical protein
VKLRGDCYVAAKPVERFVKRQIAEQGGWERILDA